LALRLALAPHAALGILKRDAEVVVAAHLDAQDVEVRVGSLDGRRLLPVEERRLDHRQVLRDGTQADLP
jgi:hypothetical protein